MSIRRPTNNYSSPADRGGANKGAGRGVSHADEPRKGRSLTKSKGSAPGNPLREGVRLFQQKKYDAAVQELLQAKPSSEDYPRLSYYLGLCYTHLHSYDEALLYLEQVVTSEIGLPHIYQSRMILGYIYTVTERYRLAEFEFSKLLDEGFESAKVHAALGHVLFAQNQSGNSIEHLERALEMDPENATALNSLGYVMAENDMRLSEAFEYCKQAVKAAPHNPAYLDSLGWVFFRRRQLPEARRVLSEALKKAPNHPDIRAHLRTVINEIKRDGETSLNSSIGAEVPEE
ncbi:MAG: tetratricopeptide repeat protein [Spirochaeta sp.]|nr:tetratricopeptide repeat protein [Spirochaeta sp.]